jgi:hypothetical protein
MGSMTVKFKAPNLDAVANEFEDNAKRAEENSKRKGIPQKQQQYIVVRLILGGKLLIFFVILSLKINGQTILNEKTPGICCGATVVHRCIGNCTKVV